MKGRFGASLAAAALLLVTACAQQEEILPGPRLDVRAPFGGAPAANEARPIRLAAPRTNADWPQRAASAAHVAPHVALSASPRNVWASPVGQGNDRKHRIGAEPVVAVGAVYTLDSRAKVSATSTGGAPLWAADLTPPLEKEDDASGGGLALGDGRLFAATGFGELVAMEPGSGKVLWRQKLQAPPSGPPAVSGGTVYVSTRDSRGIAVRARDGRVLWQVQGVPATAGVAGAGAPAAKGRYVIFPFTSGELKAVFATGGLDVWTGYVNGARPGEAYARITDVTGDPVIVGDTVYAANAAGRAVALDLVTGENRWTAGEGAVGTPVVAGGSVFLVSDRAQLVRLDAHTGARIWAVPLPKYVPVRNVRRQRDIYANFGPVLAGGRLWVASSDGKLRGFDPASGALAVTVDMPVGAASAPVVAGKTLYVLGQDGTLMAFR